MTPSLTLLLVVFLVLRVLAGEHPAQTRPKERPASTVELRASGSASGKALLRLSCSWSRCFGEISVSTRSTTTALGTTRLPVRSSLLLRRQR